MNPRRIWIIIGAVVAAVAIAIAAFLLITTITNAQNSYDRSFCVAAGASDCD